MILWMTALQQIVIYEDFMIVVVCFQLIFLNNTNYSACRDLLPNSLFGL